MEQTKQRFAHRCLPLLISNSAGWLLLSPRTIYVTWNGGADKADLSVQYPDGAGDFPASSHFGHGILTWHLPYLFRTDAGTNLLVRGPANLIKDGITALEGIVETDWCPATFTMNWKMTRPATTISFEQHEPFCMLVPQRRGELEACQTQIRSLPDDPLVASAYQQWSASREHFLSELSRPGSEAAKQEWQKDYFQGKDVVGHQTKLHLQAFNHILEKEVY